MKFSIIIPSYNTPPHYLNDCLLSILKQDFPTDQFEVIVVDDCSTSFFEEYSKYAKKYNNLKIIRHPENKRQGGARNTGIDVAKGEYILFVDSDDCWVYDNVLSLFEEFIRLYPEADFIQSNGCVDIDDSYHSKITPYNLRPSVSKYNLDKFVLSDRYTFCVWRSCYKKDFINAFKFRENVQFEDGDWCLKTICKAKCIVELDFHFYAYRNNLNSTVRAGGRAIMLANILCNAIMRDHLLADTTISNDVRYHFLACIRNNMIGTLHFFRNETISDHFCALKEIKSKGLLNVAQYGNPCLKDRILLTLMGIIPMTLVLTIRVLVNFKRLTLSLHA